VILRHPLISLRSFRWEISLSSLLKSACSIGSSCVGGRDGYKCHHISSWVSQVYGVRRGHYGDRTTHTKLSSTPKLASVCPSLKTQLLPPCPTIPLACIHVIPFTLVCPKLLWHIRSVISCCIFTYAFCRPAKPVAVSLKQCCYALRHTTLARDDIMSEYHTTNQCTRYSLESIGTDQRIDQSD
jgi:hypothetical protein